MDTVRKVNVRADKNETVQGFYVVNASGDAYGFNNNRNVQIVLDFMRSKLADFNSSPQTKVTIAEQPDSIPDPPADSTVLRIYQRIMPVPAGSNYANQNVQRDHFWLLASEKEQLLKGVVADSLSLRLCRFVFNDAVRGEPDMWTLSQIKKREFSATVEEDVVTLRGNFHMQTEDNKRGIEGKIHAEVRYKEGDVLDFKAVADAEAWGRSTYTPDEPEGRFPLKFAFVMAPKARDTVAPQATSYGPSYLTGR